MPRAELIAAGKIKVKDLITATFPPGDFARDLHTLVKRSDGAIKAVIAPNGRKQELSWISPMVTQIEHENLNRFAPGLQQGISSVGSPTLAWLLAAVLLQLSLAGSKRKHIAESRSRSAASRKLPLGPMPEPRC